MMVKGSIDWEKMHEIMKEETDKEIAALEQELHMIDELLARRPALADFDTRVDKIAHAINTASQRDALGQRCRELEAENAELRKRLQTGGLDN